MSSCVIRICCCGEYPILILIIDDGKCSAEKVRTQFLRASKWQTGARSQVRCHNILWSFQCSARPLYLTENPHWTHEALGSLLHTNVA